MKVRVALITILIFCASISLSHSFVHQKTIAGSELSWPKTSSIALYVNGANSSGIPSATIVSRAATSAALWNNSGGPQLYVYSNSSGPQDGRSDVYFSNSTQFFSSSSVLAVTESVYSQFNGDIIESDIILKDSILFSNAETSSPYIGDVLSHEMGHLIGLDHSTLAFSTMFYKLTRGQVSPSYDDHLGKNMLYDVKAASGSISGTIAGGDGLVGVFAADVRLISSKEGRVIASTLTNSDGTFIFNGVPTDDVYYIYVSPLKVKGSLSSFYQTVKTDFCTGFVDYKGSFFESCDSSRKGFPQGIDLTSTSTVDVGVVSIKCNLSVPSNYFSSRSGSQFTIGNADRSGDSIVGYFTESDVTNGEEDNLYIDLSHLDTSSGNLYLDLSLISQDFNSKVAYEIEVTSPLGFFTYTYNTDDDVNPNLNLKGRILLDSVVQSNNVFDVKITPIEFDTFIGTTPFTLEGLFFPDFATIGDDRYFYQFIYFVSQSSGVDYPVFSHYSYPSSRGNSQCMDGQKTYSVKSAGAVTGITSESFKTKKESEEASLVACGSVALVGDDDGGGPKPPVILSLLMGILLSFALFRFKPDSMN